MSAAFTLRSLWAAMVGAVWTVSNETMLAYVMIVGAQVMLEVFNFYVKNYAAFNPLVVNGHALTRVQTFEGNVHVFHFFGDGICPKGVAIVHVNVKSMGNQGGNLNPKHFKFFFK